MASKQQFFQVCVETGWNRLSAIEAAIARFPKLTRAEAERGVDECFEAVAVVKDQDRVKANPRVKRPKYCSQRTISNCVVCSLSSYGRDCMNEPLPDGMTEDTVFDEALKVGAWVRIKTSYPGAAAGLVFEVKELDLEGHAVLIGEADAERQMCFWIGMNYLHLEGDQGD